MAHRLGTPASRPARGPQGRKRVGPPIPKAQTAWNADLRSAQRAEGPRVARRLSSRATEARGVPSARLHRQRTIPQLGVVPCAARSRTAVPTGGRRSKPAAPSRRLARRRDGRGTAGPARLTAQPATTCPTHVPERSLGCGDGSRGRGSPRVHGYGFPPSRRRVVEVRFRCTNSACLTSGRSFLPDIGPRPCVVQGRVSPSGPDENIIRRKGTNCPRKGQIGSATPWRLAPAGVSVSDALAVTAGCRLQHRVGLRRVE